MWVDDRGRYVVDDEGQAWFYVTIIDITEKMSYQRKLERAEERVEMLTVLSRDVIFRYRLPGADRRDLRRFRGAVQP